MGIAHHEPTGSDPEPDRNDKVKNGEYLMRLVHCWECHSGTDGAPRDPGDPLWMAGGRVEELPGLGKVAWTLGYYAKYAAALRERAERMGGNWTPATLERALWALAGGKAGVR